MKVSVDEVILDVALYLLDEHGYVIPLHGVEKKIERLCRELMISCTVSDAKASVLDVLRENINSCYIVHDQELNFACVVPRDFPKKYVEPLRVRRVEDVESLSTVMNCIIYGWALERCLKYGYEELLGPKAILKEFVDNIGVEKHSERIEIKLKYDYVNINVDEMILMNFKNLYYGLLGYGKVQVEDRSFTWCLGTHAERYWVMAYIKGFWDVSKERAIEQLSASIETICRFLGYDLNGMIKFEKGGFIRELLEPIRKIKKASVSFVMLDPDVFNIRLTLKCSIGKRKIGVEYPDSHLMYFMMKKLVRTLISAYILGGRFGASIYTDTKTGERICNMHMPFIVLVPTSPHMRKLLEWFELGASLIMSAGIITKSLCSDPRGFRGLEDFIDFFLMLENSARLDTPLVGKYLAYSLSKLLFHEVQG